MAFISPRPIDWDAAARGFHCIVEVMNDQHDWNSKTFDAITEVILAAGFEYTENDEP